MLIKSVLDYIHNYFVKEIYTGKFTIENGSLIIDDLIEGQYFMIKGSVLNDGVYQYSKDKLVDETFKGSVFALAIPRDVLEIVDEIETWQANNKKIIESPYQSESFGGYSYSKASLGNANGSSQLTWKDIFGHRLNAYRKLS